MIVSGVYVGEEIQRVLNEKLPRGTIVTLEILFDGPRLIREPALRAMLNRIEAQFSEQIFVRSRSWTDNPEDLATLTFEVIANPIITIAVIWKIILTIATLLFLSPALKTIQVELPKVFAAASTGLQVTGFALPLILGGVALIALRR